MDSLELLDFSSFIIFSDDPWSLLVSFCQLFKLSLVVQCCNVICEWPLCDVQALDAGVGHIVDSLVSAGLYDDSLLLFSTDNGGAVRGFSNLPLRGDKEQLYEGGVRGVALVTGGVIPRGQRGKLNNG